MPLASAARRLLRPRDNTAAQRWASVTADGTDASSFIEAATIVPHRLQRRALVPLPARNTDCVPFAFAPVYLGCCFVARLTRTPGEGHLQGHGATSITAFCSLFKAQMDLLRGRRRERGASSLVVRKGDALGEAISARSAARCVWTGVARSRGGSWCGQPVSWWSQRMGYVGEGQLLYKGDFSSFLLKRKTRNEKKQKTEVTT